jgi:hypothetical protein
MVQKGKRSGWERMYGFVMVDVIFVRPTQPSASVPYQLSRTTHPGSDQVEIDSEVK